ncbi:hypothetical protein TNCV_2281191 [Trichonephila clavipes]|nr:hypothetical protein TNCV_2281191 [Trichonephila clavipes]
MLGRQIAALSHSPSSVTELKRALQEAWNRLSPQLIQHPIATKWSRSRIRRRRVMSSSPTAIEYQTYRGSGARSIGRSLKSSRWRDVVIRGGAHSDVVLAT